MFTYIFGAIVLLVLVWLMQTLYRHNQEYYTWEHTETDIIANRTIIFTSVNESYVGDLVKKHSSYMNKYAQLHPEISLKRFVHEDGKISPYWTRVFDLLELGNSYPDGTLFVYLDTDAIVNSKHFDVSVSEFLHDIDPGNTRDLYISEDPLAEYPFFYDGTYNTGVLIVRNSENSRKFIKEWSDMYDADNWSFNSGKWKCHIKDRECNWSALGYEQYAFSTLAGIKKNAVFRLHHKVLANQNYRDTKAFIVHLMGRQDNYRINVINKMEENLK